MEKYYVSDGKIETGPYILEQLKEIPLNENFLVWKTGMDKWVRLHELPELKDIVYSVPPPISRYNKKIIRNYKI